MFLTTGWSSVPLSSVGHPVGTSLAIHLPLQANTSEVLSDFQFEVQVPENCETRLIGGMGKKNADLFISLVHSYVLRKKGVYTSELSLDFIMYNTAQHKRVV